jgi:drug/metabolite transporter (DMT)-like permease
MTHPLHHRALLWLLVATFLWSISFPFVQILYVEQKSLLPGASTLFLSTLLMATRFGIATMLMLPFVVGKMAKFTAREWEQGLSLALFGGVGMWLQADALAYTKASTCAFITQGYCVFLPLIHAIKQRRIPNIRIIMAMIMVVIGVAWLSGVKPSELHMGRGEAQTLLAAAIFTLQILCLENPRYQNNRSLPITWIMFLGITAFALPCAYIIADQPSDLTTAMQSTSSWILVATMSLLCSIAAFGLMNHWQGFVHSVEAGLIYCTEPVFTSIVAMFLPAIIGRMIGHPIANETWTYALIGGGLLITVANITVQQKPPQKTTTNDQCHS